MPPPTPPSPLPSAGSIVPLSSNEEVVMGLFNLDGVGLALADARFDQAELVRIMISHARDGDPKVSLPGVRQLLAYTKDVATLNGRIGQARVSRKESDESGTTQRTVTSNTLVSRLTQTRPSGPLQAGTTHHPPHEPTLDGQAPLPD